MVLVWLKNPQRINIRLGGPRPFHAHAVPRVQSAAKDNGYTNRVSQALAESGKTRGVIGGILAPHAAPFGIAPAGPRFKRDGQTVTPALKRNPASAEPSIVMAGHAADDANAGGFRFVALVRVEVRPGKFRVLMAGNAEKK